jgi:valyl-tRNA synthetase
LTEEVYQHLPETKGMLILAQWPEVDESLLFEEEERRMEGLMEIIRAIRNLRAELKVAANRRTHVTLLCEPGWEDTLALAEPYLQRLAGASEVSVRPKGLPGAPRTVSAVCAPAEIRIPLGDLVDIDKQIARLGKEHERLAAEIDRAKARLCNPGFTGKAPAALVEQEKEKLATNESMLASLARRIEELKADA